MKTIISHALSLLLTVALFLSSTPSADAQRRHGRHHKSSKPTSSIKIQQPASPTPLDVKERTIQDLLFFPYGCISGNISNPDEAKSQLESTFGSHEIVNLYVGLHKNDAYDYTYQGVPIGLCYADWFDNRHWYEFYFDSKAEAQEFYNRLTADIKKVGIPLTKDPVYGNLSNRKHPVSIFKTVYVDQPVLVKEADQSNIHKENVVGKWFIELGVYKKK